MSDMSNMNMAGSSTAAVDNNADPGAFCFGTGMVHYMDGMRTGSSRRKPTNVLFFSR